MQNDIPTTWLHCEWTDLSWFPSLRVTRDSQRVKLKASRSGYLVALILLLVAASVWMIGSTLTSIPSWFLLVIVAMLAFGAVLSPIAITLIVRVFGTRLSVHTEKRLVEILSAKRACSLPFDDIVAIQYLTQPRAAQVNLAYRDTDDSIARICLYAHANPKYVLAIARDFIPFVRWPVLDSEGQSVG